LEELQPAAVKAAAVMIRAAVLHRCEASEIRIPLE